MAARKRPRQGALFYNTDLPADTEYGDWTPTLSIGGVPVTTTVSQGAYYRIGRVVTVALNIEFTVDLSADAGVFTLPYPNGWRRVGGSTISTYGFGVFADSAYFVAPAGSRSLSARSISDSASSFNLCWIGDAGVVNVAGTHTTAGNTKRLATTFTYFINMNDL